MEQLSNWEADCDFDYRFPWISKKDKNSFTLLHKFQVDKKK